MTSSKQGVHSILSIERCPISANTLLESYSTNGAYTDCYVARIPIRVSFPEFIFAFYTTPLFKLERFILRWLVSKPSSDPQVKSLAEGHMNRFAAWRVENRSANELLLCDDSGRTRSWLMTIPDGTPGIPQTRLLFGSAVIPTQNAKTGAMSLGWVFQALIGFHRIYSILLLYSAKLRITHQQ